MAGMPEILAILKGTRLRGLELAAVEVRLALD